MKLTGETGSWSRFFSWLTSQSVTSRSGSRRAAAASTTALTTLKMAVVAPMPRASASDGGGGKGGSLDQAPNAVAQILQKIVRRHADGLQP